MPLKEEKISQIHNHLDMIVEELEAFSIKGAKLHEVERSLLSNLLQLGLELLSYYILLVSKLVQQQGSPVDGQGKKMQNKGCTERAYFSIFGRLRIARTKYYGAAFEKTCYPADRALGLPSGR